MFSNKYIFVYSTILVVVAASILSIAAVVLKPFQQKNQEVEKMQQLLSSVGIVSEADNAEELYNKYFTEEYGVNPEGEIVSSYINQQQTKGSERPFKADMKKELQKVKSNDSSASLPVFVCNKDGKKNYVVPVSGAGLWGGIWGYMAVDEALSTVVGVNFGHKSETPGLGAEITTEKFQNQFKGKQVFENSQVKLEVKKRADKQDKYQVDAISGATITSTGVSNMIKDCLGLYIKYFETIKTDSNGK